MPEMAELSTIDQRYESYRMKNPRLEARLLASIAERGIEEPLEGVDVGSQKILLNGFKRYRCAQKLGLGIVPYTTLGKDEASAILAMLRASNTRSLSILEQARFIDDLRTIHKLTLGDIAELLSRSKAWVSMRRGQQRSRHHRGSASQRRHCCHAAAPNHGAESIAFSTANASRNAATSCVRK